MMTLRKRVMLAYTLLASTMSWRSLSHVRPRSHHNLFWSSDEASRLQMHTQEITTAQIEMIVHTAVEEAAR